MSLATCAACEKVFSSVAVFDDHRIGDFSRGGQKPCTRRCMTDEEMRASGLITHPSRKHCGKAIWANAAKVSGWQARKAILAAPGMLESALWGGIL